MQYATQQWTPEQLADHRITADKLGRIVNAAFTYAGNHLAEGVNEFEVAEFIRNRFAAEGIASPDGPIVAVNANASDPHYEPSADRYSLIKQGDWLLIDLWAKGVARGSVYADITWVAYVGDAVPQRQQEIFDIVIGARDAALHYLEDAYNQGNAVQGWQADQVARDYISSGATGSISPIDWATASGSRPTAKRSTWTVSRLTTPATSSPASASPSNQASTCLSSASVRR
jgi:Xaa-Pro aminopeptidase